MKYLLLLFFAGLVSCTTAQLPVTDKNQSTAVEAGFPEIWAGIYRGSLEIFTAAGLQQTVAMELEIAPTDSINRWVWALTYGPDSVAGRRSYELVVTDSTKGHYQIDEKNSIVLDGYLRGDIFVSRFSVMGNLLDCTYEKVADEIIFTIVTGKETTIATGGGVMAGDTIPVVQGYPVGVVQRGRLRRIIPWKVE